MSKSVFYISGPITGVERYWEAFEAAEDARLERAYCNYIGKAVVE